MDTARDFARKQRKYMPVFPKATGKPTVYIEGYPYEDDEPMPGTGFHGEQINIFYEQLRRYFMMNEHIYIGVDNFIYYRRGDMAKVVAPDVYVVLGAKKYPLRRSFYTWAEGVVPTTVFEFLSDTTAAEDRVGKVAVYLREMGVQEYFIHQPELEKPAEFRGWRRSAAGDIIEMVPDAGGSLFSEALNLYFRWEIRVKSDLRLLRPYLADGMPITTAMEEHELRVNAQVHANQAEMRANRAEVRAESAEVRAETAEARAESAEVHAEAAAARAEAETQQRQELETELERLRRQLANRR